VHRQLFTRFQTMQLTKSFNAWQIPAFKETLRAELGLLDARLLPLQQGLTHGNYALEGTVSATILRATEKTDCIIVHAGLFYRSLIAGCNCTDDPTPIVELDEHCEVQLTIEKITADAAIMLAN